MGEISNETAPPNVQFSHIYLNKYCDYVGVCVLGETRKGTRRRETALIALGMAVHTKKGTCRWSVLVPR